MSDVESWLIGQSLRFAAEITETHPEVPQILAATEGLAFVLHALRRETFRSSEWKAWDGIFEPLMKNMYQLFAMTISAWSNSDFDRSRLAGDAQALVSARSLEYQTLPFLYGPVEDRQTVIYAAARRIAECVEPARRDDVIAAATRLYARFVEFALPDQVANLAKVLYGRRAVVAA
ncbi:MAG TPA: hypothetical protein VH020_15415 [Stellaceae bacterium]|nr:hypothetical protein [Stellaceae bacterium]